MTAITAPPTYNGSKFANLIKANTTRGDSIKTIETPKKNFLSMLSKTGSGLDYFLSSIVKIKILFLMNFGLPVFDIIPINSSKVS